jgi:hypothetical protein
VGLALDRERAAKLALALDFGLKSELELEFELDGALTGLLEWAQMGTRGSPRYRARARAFDLGRRRPRSSERELELKLWMARRSGGSQEVEFVAALKRDLARVIDLARMIEHSTLGLTDSQFAARIEELSAELPAGPAAWWREKWVEWNERLIATARSRDFGRIRGITNEEVGELKDYYDAHLLLVECIEAARGLTTKARQYVETTMLLPYTDIWPFHG